MDPLITMLANKARENINSHKHFAPVALVTKDGVVTLPIVLNYKDDQEKFESYYNVGKLVKDMFNKNIADRVVILSDAAMKRFYGKKDIEKVLKNLSSESPLTYPESMRQDGILIVDIDLTTKKNCGYFDEYKKKSEEFIFNELVKIGQVPGELSGQFLKGFTEGEFCGNKL